MPFSYVIYKQHRLVISTGSEHVTWNEIKARQDEAIADPDFDSQFNQIVDLRAVTGFDMSPEEVRMLARRLIFSPRAKRAFIAASPAIFGVGRMYEAFSELSGDESQIRVFYDVSSALQWLGMSDLSRLLPASAC